MLNVLGSSNENINPDQLKEADITVSAVEKVNLEGTTWYYIESESKDIFKVAFQSRYEDTLVFLKKGMFFIYLMWIMKVSSKLKELNKNKSIWVFHMFRLLTNYIF